MYLFAEESVLASNTEVDSQYLTQTACSTDPGAVTWIEMKKTTMENMVIYLLS